MRRLTILLLVVAALAVWALSGSRDPTLPDVPSRSERPEDEPAVVPDVVPGDGSTPGRDGSILRQPVRIQGTVKDADGRAVPGATVTEIHADGASSVTDENGHYEFTVSRPDPTLRIEAAGFAPRITGKVGGDLELRRGATVSGRVTDHAGRPVEGAKIFELRDPDRSVATDVNGNFRFEGARTGFPTMFAAHHPDYLPGKTDLLNLAPGAEISDMKIMVRRASRIRGTVRPWPGTGAVPTTVWVEGPPKVVTVTRDGNFLLEPVGAGAAIVHASTPEGRVARCPVDVPEFEECDRVELRLGAIFSARVLDDRGDHVPGVVVKVRCEGGQSPGYHGTGGRRMEDTIRIGLPFAKEWIISAIWAGGGTVVEPFRVEPSEEIRILRVPRPGFISGRVLSKGQPVRQFSVRIQRKDGRFGTNGRDGAFRSWSVPPGPATITILSATGWSDPREVVLQPGQELSGLEFEVRTGTFLVCRVLEKNGVPALRADVRLRSDRWGEKNAVWTSSAMAFTTPVDPGKYEVRVFDEEGKLRAEREVELEADELQKVEIRLD